MEDRVSSLLSAERPFAICGPCVIESREHALQTGQAIAAAGRSAGVSLVFKASFDKANRTSVGSFRGPGMARGLEILAEVRHKTGLPVLTDIHEPAQAVTVGEVCDILQIPGLPLPTDRPAGRRRSHWQGGQHQEGPVPGPR